MTKDTAYLKISELVERFTEQFTSYKKSDYNETLTRRDFIDPFFKALGWDVDNSNGYAEAYREVIHEDKVKIGGATKAPDYSFRLGGGKKLFFVEAKKPSVFIKDEVLPAYQIRRYGWSAKLPVSIITDFEEFAVYDCRKKPNPTDKASVARIKYLTYKDYLKDFDFLWDTFSKEKVLKGSFDKYVQNDSNKKGTTTVDNEFLISLDHWRTILAVDICKQNKLLDEDEVNFAVQQTLDRLIFLRISEDRSVEPYGRLKDCIKTGNFYKNLFDIFREADEKYNSGLFDFKKDSISKNLILENKTIKAVINELYYPESPYEFSVLSVEILGSAYEQFLGKQITVGSNHQAVIEYKPGVKKSGGVFYTPPYLVEYVIQQTLGKLLKNKTPKDASKIKIVDPACGSGGFLIGAYQYLLEWHKTFYHNNPISTNKKSSSLSPEGNLTTFEKKRILLNSIYGVDIDNNAVEVTKLSLLLKCMEGETSASIAHQLSFFNDRVLPTLDNNIKSGNSLIETDYYDTIVDYTEEKKIKPFNWKKNFPSVFAQDGFDIIVGNPPWGAELQKPEKDYLLNKFPIVPSKTKDTYFYFIFNSLLTAKKGTIFGLVLPNTWLLINNAKGIREFLLGMRITEIIDHGDSVFKDAIVETSSLIFENIKDEKGNCVVKRIKKGKVIVEGLVNKNLWKKDPLKRFVIEADEKFEAFIQTINKISEPFIKNCDIIFGIKPYQVGHGKPPQTKDMVNKRIYHSEVKIDDQWKPLLTGTDINRYTLNFNDDLYIKYGEWLMYKSNEGKMLQPKIFLRRTSDTLRACYDDRGYYGQNSLFIVTSSHDLKFLLGLLNSKLMNYIYQRKCPQKGKIFAEIKPSIIKELPIIKINTPKQHQLKDTIIKYVDQILSLKNGLKSIRLATKIEQLNHQIEHYEDNIDIIVMELYGLDANALEALNTIIPSGKLILEE